MNYIPRPNGKRNKGSKEILNQSEVGIQTKKTNYNRENRRNRKNRNTIIENVKSRKKFLFWNVAGIFNKDTEFWDYVVENDYVSLSETWVENKEIGYVKSMLPVDFE